MGRINFELNELFESKSRITNVEATVVLKLNEGTNDFNLFYYFKK